MKLRLSSKLIISIVLIEVLMLSVLVWNSVRLISSSHAERLEDQSQEKATLLANLLAPGLAVSDRAILLDSLSLIAGDHEIVYATVSDTKGERMAEIGEPPALFQADASYVAAKRDGTFDVTQDIALFGQQLGILQLGFSIDQVEGLIRKTRIQNTTIAIIEILLSVTVTLLVGYFLTRNLRKLEAGAHALTRDELDHRINLESQDEIGDLARSFNGLAEHLSATRSALALEHRALTENAQHLQTLLDGVDAVITEFDPQLDRLIYVSLEAERLLGYPANNWLEAGFLDNHIHPDDLPSFKANINTRLDTPSSFNVDFRMIHRDGRWLWIRSINSIESTTSKTQVCRGILLDVTEQKQSEERIIYLAEHDALSGLYNRRRFQEELERELEVATRFGQAGALMFIDLDQFKYINDSLGHQAGDEYLYAISRRLVGKLRKVDTLGRLGGDEFGVILPKTDRKQAELVADNLLRALASESIGLNDLDTPVTASIGIVIFSGDEATPGKLLAMADAAMYRAKDKGRNGYHVYQDDDRTLTKMQAKLQWENRIRAALANDDFVLHYQPIFRLNSRDVSHYEVLLRMRNDDGKLIPPSAFLEVAERFGMIRNIDRWVLVKAIHAQAQSQSDAHPLSLAINLSGRHFGNPEVLKWIRDAIKGSHADPTRLIFEITETAAVENIQQASNFVEALHHMGCRIALDDFGVGFSSFHYLKHLPVDMIKLDGNFIRNLTRDGFDRVFVKTMSDMANGLGIVSIAEFVETEAIVEVLVELGVMMGQGYHLAKPIDACPFPCITYPAKVRSTANQPT